jgi:hypothetical protein
VSYQPPSAFPVDPTNQVSPDPYIAPIPKFKPMLPPGFAGGVNIAAQPSPLQKAYDEHTKAVADLDATPSATLDQAQYTPPNKTQSIVAGLLSLLFPAGGAGKFASSYLSGSEEAAKEKYAREQQADAQKYQVAEQARNDKQQAVQNAQSEVQNAQSEADFQQRAQQAAENAASLAEYRRDQEAERRRNDNSLIAKRTQDDARARERVQVAMANSGISFLRYQLANRHETDWVQSQVDRNAISVRGQNLLAQTRVAISAASQAGANLRTNETINASGRRENARIVTEQASKKATAIMDAAMAKVRQRTASNDTAHVDPDVTATQVDPIIADAAAQAQAALEPVRAIPMVGKTVNPVIDAAGAAYGSEYGTDAGSPGSAPAGSPYAGIDYSAPAQTLGTSPSTQGAGAAQSGVYPSAPYLSGLKGTKFDASALPQPTPQALQQGIPMRGGVFPADRLKGLMHLWTSEGGDPKAAYTMATVAAAESSGNPNAPPNVNTDGSVDTGLWQINSSHGITGNLHDPHTNARAAVGLYNARIARGEDPLADWNSSRAAWTPALYPQAPPDTGWEHGDYSPAMTAEKHATQLEQTASQAPPPGAWNQAAPNTPGNNAGMKPADNLVGSAPAAPAAAGAAANATPPPPADPGHVFQQALNRQVQRVKTSPNRYDTAEQALKDVESDAQKGYLSPQEAQQASAEIRRAGGIPDPVTQRPGDRRAAESKASGAAWNQVLNTPSVRGAMERAHPGPGASLSLPQLPPVARDMPAGLAPQPGGVNVPQAIGQGAGAAIGTAGRVPQAIGQGANVAAGSVSKVPQAVGSFLTRAAQRPVGAYDDVDAMMGRTKPAQASPGARQLLAKIKGMTPGQRDAFLAKIHGNTALKAYLIANLTGG